MPELGRAALVLCLGLSFYAVVAGAYAARKGLRRLALSASNALIAAFAAAAAGSAVLLVALSRHDFSFTYVAQHTSSKLPLGYSLSAFWGGQEGSMLLWLLVLTGYSAAVVVMVPRLQTPYMLAHPPLLYLGFVGLTVPFAFGMGSLLARRADERWIVATRRWTLAAWAFLGIGQLLGSHWAYVEIGWGGYFAWDPVENAALMPWLAATAFLHSVMVQEKKGMLKIWNMLLVILAFCLSLFGTFLTRSGILNSIHSFTESSIGPWLLGFIAFVTAASLTLVFARLPLLRAKTKLESLISREASFLYNNLLLVALCLTILWGVVFPILSELVRGESSAVRGPYYNFFLRSFGLPLLLLMGIGPLLAWRRSSLRALGRTFAWPAAVSLAAGGILLAIGAGSSIPGLIAYTFSAFVLASIVLEFLRGTRARHATSGGLWPGAFSALIARNRRRYGGYVVHASVVLLAIGIAGNAYGSSQTARLARGDALRIGDYRLVYRGWKTERTGNAIERRATVDVFRHGGRIGVMHPGKNAYPVEQQMSNEVSIRSDWRSGGDLFLIAQQLRKDGGLQLKALINPLVNFIWLAGIVFVGGALIALWPDAREQRRLVARYGGVPAEA